MARLGLNASLHLGAEQHLLLQPRMLQSIELLSIPAAELEDWLSAQAESNAALVVDRPPPERRGTREESEAHDEMLRNQPQRSQGLVEALEEQLLGLELAPSRLEWVRLLIAALDASGFLSTSDEELLRLAQERGLAGGAEELGLALATLQELEPRGIGARDAIEAMLMQLDPADEDYPLLCRLLEEFLEELAKNRMPRVARAMGLALEDLERLIDVLRELDPRPASALVEEGAPRIVPDVLVERGEAGYEVSLKGGQLPTVGIDPDLRALASDRGTAPEVRRWLRGRIDQARWIVEAVAQRGETLLRVSRAVFARQRAFLDHGPGHLAPLTMGEVAEELLLHVSTVSRAVAGKYAQTPWGILPLRSFFQVAAGEGDDGAQSVAQDRLRETLREVFEGEDKSSPLSDDEVVAALAARGIHVARRTVAKYRSELGIPSSYRRRRYR